MQENETSEENTLFREKKEINEEIFTPERFTEEEIKLLKELLEEMKAQGFTKENIEALRKMQKQHDTLMVKLLSYANLQEITLAELLELDPASIENSYENAYTKYVNGLYHEATIEFRTLLLLDPTDWRFAFGFAASLEGAKCYEPALRAYELCSRIDPFRHESFLQAGICLAELKEPLMAADQLLQALVVMGDEEKYAKERTRAEQILLSFKEEIEERPKQKKEKKK